MRPLHTPASENCESCTFWDDHGDEADAKPREGSCCRFPPVRNLLEENDLLPPHSFFSYPVTGGHWWCGEFQFLETGQPDTSEYWT